MCSLHKIFHEASGRCADYKEVTGASDNEFPMQFVSHHWVENEPVKTRMKQESSIYLAEDC